MFSIIWSGIENTVATFSETSFQRSERTGMRKIEKGIPFMLAGDAKSSPSNEGAFGATRGEIAGEKHAPPTLAVPGLNT